MTQCSLVGFPDSIRVLVACYLAGWLLFRSLCFALAGTLRKHAQHVLAIFEPIFHT